MSANLGTTTVIGAGSWGTALAIVLSENGCETYLWGRDPLAITEMSQSRCNKKFLPNKIFPEKLIPSANLDEVLKKSDLVIIAVPSVAFRKLLPALQAHISHLQGVAWATKGLDPTSCKLLHDVYAELMPDTLAYAIISGPSFAKEVAAGLPAAVSLASPSSVLSELIIKRLHCKTFRVYPTEDVIGVQLGGAVKNVLAIAAGITDGLKLGANARAALITRGLAEMIRLGEALGGERETFMGLAGLGDLILTCSDDQSRNRRLGLFLGQGISIAEAKEQIKQTIEGINTVNEVITLARHLQIEMPICEQVYRVLYENVSAKDAVKALLAREPKSEEFY